MSGGTVQVAGRTKDASAARSLGELVDLGARNRPDALAILAPGETPLTYAELRRWVGEIGAAIRAAGVRRQDRVAIVLPNGPEMAAAFLAAARVATAAPLNPTYRADELEFYFSDLDAKLLVTRGGASSPAVQVARARGTAVLDLATLPRGESGDGAAPPFPTAAPEDVALVLHTSGTTSRPKLVPLSHANLLASARHVRETLRLSEADRCLNVMPLFHIHGLVAALLASLSAGGTVVCTQGFYAPRFFEWLEECQPTWYTAVPTMHQALLARAGKHVDIIARRPLRFIRSSSAALPRPVLAELERTFGAPVIEAYGMTEAAHQMASNPLPPGERRPGSVGLPAGPDIAVLNGSGELLPAGAEGEVAIRGPNVTRGYERNPEANAASFTHGWFRTGDQGWLDPDGYLHLSGRLKEIINRGGEKISPREVDEVLMDHPGVAQAVTFALPSARLGEEVGAVVVLRPGLTVSEPVLRDFAATRLADFKVPVLIRFVDEIPKGPTGKLQRIGLAALLGLDAIDRPAPPDEREFVAPRTPVEELLAGIWSDVLRVERLGVHDHFLDVGGDSMLAGLVVSRILEKLGLELPMRSLFDAPTVAEQAALVQPFLEDRTQ